MSGFTAEELKKQIDLGGFEALETEYYASGKGDARPCKQYCALLDALIVVRCIAIDTSPLGKSH